MTPDAIEFLRPEPRDPLAGASLIAGQIGFGIVEATLAHQALISALQAGDLFKINAALLKIRTGAQSAHVLAYSLHKDVTAKMRREPRVRS